MFGEEGAEQKIYKKNGGKNPLELEKFAEDQKDLKNGYNKANKVSVFFFFCFYFYIFLYFCIFGGILLSLVSRFFLMLKKN